MKTGKLVIVMFLFVWCARAQPYINIPDPAFRTLIDSLAPGSIIGTTLNISHPGVTGLNFMDISNPAIYDITGIQYFGNLIGLFSSAQSVGIIPAFPPNLQNLSLYGCPLTGLPALPVFLFSLHVENCGLSSLPVLPASLTVLSISNNNFVTLPSLPASLSSLYCDNNLLTSIPALPPALTTLNCANNIPTNPYTFLPALPNSLQNLYATGNNIYCLPNIPNNGNFYSDISMTVCQPRGTPDTWYALQNLPGGLTKELATSFAVGGKGYVSCGVNNISSNDLWQFDPVGNVWTQKANLPGVPRIGPFSFAAGTKGYLGCGQQSGNPYALNDFYEYNPATNVWTQKANYPGIVYFGMGSFVINNKGFVAGGFANPPNQFHNELYKYDPVTNTWIQKTAITGYGRTDISCFAIGNKGYLCGGDYQNGLFNSCYVYNAGTDSWSAIANLPVPLNEYAAFAVNGRGYIVGGQPSYWNFGGSKAVYEYDPGTNYWYKKTDLPGTDRRRTTGFAINGKGYVTTGLIANPQTGNYTRSGHIFEYTPSQCLPTITTISAGGPTTFCSGGSVTLTANPSAGLTFQWFNSSMLIPGATDSAYVATATGSYSVVSTNAGGCSFTSGFLSVTSGLYAATISPAGTSPVCPGGTVTFQVNACTNCSYIWHKTGVVIPGATGTSYAANQSGYYTVKVTTPAGCTGLSSTATLTIINTNPVVSASGSSVICSGDSVNLYFSGSAGTSYQWNKNGNPLPGVVNYYYYAKTAGNYTVTITNTCGIFTSSPLAVTVNQLPLATITASGATTFCQGGSVTLNAPVAANRSYQWKKNGTVIPGAVSSSYPATTSGTYKAIVTNTNTGCSKTTGTGTTVLVNSNPAVSATPQGPTTFCAGDSVQLKASYNSSWLYQWKKNNTNIGGATSNKIYAKTAGNYKVKVTTANGCTAISPQLQITVPCKHEQSEVDLNNRLNVNVFPNPGTDRFNFHFKYEKETNTTVYLYDISGRLVTSVNTDEPTMILSTTGLRQGVYTAVVKNSSDLVKIKLIILPEGD